VSVYFDTAYVAKCYVNETDSRQVRAVLRGAGGGHSSALCRPELAAVLLRHVREGALTPGQAGRLHVDFRADTDRGVWTLLPLSEAFLARVAARVLALGPGTFVRAADAIHLWTASEAGFDEIWTNDRHLLAAAPAFGVRGRSA
jgi:predicted nucleic acid-binding protein